MTLHERVDPLIDAAGSPYSDHTIQVCTPSEVVKRFNRLLPKGSTVRIPDMQLTLMIDGTSLSFGPSSHLT